MSDEVFGLFDDPAFDEEFYKSLENDVPEDVEAFFEAVAEIQERLSGSDAKEPDEPIIRQMDADLKTLSRIFAQKQRGWFSVIYFPRVREFAQAYKLIQKAMEGNPVKIKHNLTDAFDVHDEFAAITVEAPLLRIKNTEAFYEALSLADNVDMYPRIGVGVHIDLGFYRLKISNRK